MALAVFLVSFVLLFFIGMPIAFSMITSTWIYAIIKGIDLGFLGIQMFASLDSFVLLSIPLFILTSEIMNKSSVAERIFEFANAIVGRTPGGLGHVNVVTNIIFSGMSGSAVADIGGIGDLCYKAMVKEGYDKDFSAGLTVAAAVIGPIIPPSIPMVIYSMVANVSVAKLFLGGAIPGLIMGLALMVYTYYISVKRKYPIQPKISSKEMLKSVMRALKRGILPLLTPVILLGGIYLGFVTVTEASAVAVIYSCLLGALAYHLLGMKEFIESVKKVFITCGSILIVMPAAKAFGFVLTSENLQHQFSTFLYNVAGDNKFLIILLINILFLILGCLSDPNINIMLFVPVILPLVTIAKMDPVHFGVMIVLNAMIGLTTPPVGSLLFALSGLENIEFEELAKAVWPFILILVTVLVIVIFIPQTVVFLPNLLFNK